jgi:ribosomal protein S3AE
MAAKKTTEIKVPLLNLAIEVPADEVADGKKIRLDLARMLKGKSVEATFKINAKENKAEPEKLKLLQFYVRRLVRKGTSYVEDSFICKSKDSVLRVKPFLVTRKKVSRSIRKALRNKTRELITESFKDRCIDDIFSEILFAKFQKELAGKLKKIYPLAVCEIRVIEPAKKHKQI